MAPMRQRGYDGAKPAPWRQMATLALLAGVHVGAFLSWHPIRHGSSPAGPMSHASLVFVNVAAPPARPREHEAAAPVGPAARRQPARALPATAAVAAPTAVPAPPSPLPVEDPPDVTDLLDRAKASARRLASELPANKASAPLTLEQSLGNAIAAAARPRTTTIEELQTADGRPLSKVSGPAGTYCVMRDGFGPSAGRDPFRDGPRDRVVRCPR